MKLSWAVAVLRLSLAVAFIIPVDRRPLRSGTLLHCSSSSSSGGGDCSSSSSSNESRIERQRRRQEMRREKYCPDGAELASLEVRNIAQQIPCPCQSGRYFGMCCQPVMEAVKSGDDNPELALGPEALLRARYVAYVKEDADFIILTTHYSHPEYTVDVEGWRRELVEFIRCVTFRRFEVKEVEDANETMVLLTWAARMKVLPDVLTPEKVQTKEFTERSVFLFEDGRWWYAGGDEDFEPTNELVDDTPPRPRPKGGSDKTAQKKTAGNPKKAVAARK